jgi:hypothetical protein
MQYVGSCVVIKQSPGDAVQAAVKVICNPLHPIRNASLSEKTQLKFLQFKPLLCKLQCKFWSPDTAARAQNYYKKI